MYKSCLHLHRYNHESVWILVAVEKATKEYEYPALGSPQILVHSSHFQNKNEKIKYFPTYPQPSWLAFDESLSSLAACLWFDQERCAWRLHTTQHDLILPKSTNDLLPEQLHKWKKFVDFGENDNDIVQVLLVIYELESVIISNVVNYPQANGKYSRSFVETTTKSCLHFITTNAKINLVLSIDKVEIRKWEKKRKSKLKSLSRIALLLWKEEGRRCHLSGTKHHGELYLDVYLHDPQYCVWVKSLENPGWCLSGFARWLKKEPNMNDIKTRLKQIEDCLACTATLKSDVLVHSSALLQFRDSKSFSKTNYVQWKPLPLNFGLPSQMQGQHYGFACGEGEEYRRKKDPFKTGAHMQPSGFRPLCLVHVPNLHDLCVATLGSYSVLDVYKAVTQSNQSDFRIQIPYSLFTKAATRTTVEFELVGGCVDVFSEREGRNTAKKRKAEQSIRI